MTTTKPETGIPATDARKEALNEMADFGQKWDADTRNKALEEAAKLAAVQIEWTGESDWRFEQGYEAAQEEIADAILALRDTDAAPVGVVVKELEWIDDTDDPKEPYYKADGAKGDYYIVRYDSRAVTWSGFIWGQWTDYCLKEEAIAAAQADFETRVRSLISQAPITPQQAAKVLADDDIALSRMAKAMHDGPLLADEHEYRADTKAGSWCLDMARAALRAMAEGELS